ncbi:hypothetical protein E2C01_015173 [Portunus trituberculatus]|uniref:Uncharacterized protein n=1 Tax=Portunus trituberculatus TaxID=210409 RepID=A0A5B7DLV8_PORTR|nr:hypothetical protein [Portunus trituberculatus]
MQVRRRARFSHCSLHYPHPFLARRPHTCIFTSVSPTQRVPRCPDIKVRLPSGEMEESRRCLGRESMAGRTNTPCLCLVVCEASLSRYGWAADGVVEESQVRCGLWLWRDLTRSPEESRVKP